ncbi:MAG TPA: prenyltransferase/squalene oxidase repeat-containing protein [Bryobacteraceae bacterium]|nr:prenyltransferase/squalene oxidase repeat-containing protein [Bryobacteraceae bacterium]
MKKFALSVFAVALVVTAGWAANDKDPKSNSKNSQKDDVIFVSVEKGAKWLASVQGRDGGWGQDGGESSYVRAGERLETNGNDVANTAVAVLALRRAGKEYQPNVERGLAFILARVESSHTDGLALTNTTGTQIQRKLGPYIDTFLTSMLLSEVDGTLSDPKLNARVRLALEKCVAKIQKNQQSDGSWNVGGGWAPVLGTSMASRSLNVAKQKGVKVEERTMARADAYARDTMVDSRAAGAGGAIGGRTASVSVAASAPAAAGVALYQNAQALEALTRTEKDRAKNAPQIAEIKSQLTNQRFVDGFGSMGGEEFFSYLNISDGLRRTGGEEWNKWHAQITQKIVALQNNDGTWAGHHCITGRVATTSSAMLNLTVDREPLRNARN